MESPELLITVDRDSGVGLRRQLEVGLRNAIREGRLRAGTRLPSSRALAADVGVARRMVQEAYEQLVAEGYLSARVGAGTTVNEMVRPPEPPPQSEAPVRARFDMRPAFPDLRLFPRRQWTRAAAEAMSTMTHDQLGYLDHRGLDELRGSLADYLARVRGVSTAAVDVMICNGFGHGLHVVLDALRRDGLRVVAVEDPGYDGSRDIIEHLGLNTIPVPVDDEGIDVDALRATGAGAVIVTPAHQSPLGAVMSPGRRLGLAAWARDRGAWVIEDDYDAEFRYDREPIGAVQGLCPDRTIYIGTLSKCLSPGLRLGWIVAPCGLTPGFIAVRGVIDGTTSTFLQATLSRFIERGDLDRHMRRSRQEYRRRRDALVHALADNLPDLYLGEVAAGLHVTMDLPPGVDENAIVTRAHHEGILVDSLSRFRMADHTTPQSLVIGFGRIRPSDAAMGAAALADVIKAPPARRPRAG